MGVTRAPRIFGLVATAAPVVAILRRGPTEWANVGRLRLDRRHYEAGAWFRGRLFPQKCDLSPDGRWLAYSAHKPGADWAAGEIYEAVSRLPWLDALAAWEAGTTYTRGVHFVDDGRRDNALGDPDVGDLGPLLGHFGLAVTAPVQFAVERRRGWTETAGTAPRPEGGPWDEARSVTMERASPARPDWVLQVSGGYAAFRDSPSSRTAAAYELVRGGEVEALDVQWADWGPEGELIVATLDASLRVVDCGAGGGASEAIGEVIFEVDLAADAPAPGPAPSWARSW